VGVYNYDLGAPDGGAVYRVSWSTGTLSLSAADSVFLGEATLDHAGRTVLGKDMNGDGLDDILVGTWGADTTATNAGAAYLILGLSL
jgi:hypothetical protein